MSQRKTKENLEIRGKEERIMAGMVSEVRIVTRRKKILHIVLEKLDFIDI